tara:strand:- start:25 stop:291 length:267 start_codon:yes stop_codon:yes gene_type:complete
MAKDIFENKQLEQINEIEKTLNEGFIGNALIRLVFGGKAKRIMKKAVKAARYDKELQAAFGDLKYHHEKIRDMVDTICKRNPDFKDCK